MAKEAAARHSARKPEPVVIVFSLIKGLLTAAVVTVLGVAAFALLLRLFDVSDAVVSAVNQALKLLSVFLGVRAAAGKGGGGVLKGALLGFLYMALGILGYQVFSGIDASPAAYWADLAMGVAAGGLFGMISGDRKTKK